MSKDMNKLLQQTIKYDLGSGLLIALLIVLSSSLLYAMIYLLGIVVGLLNFLCSYYVTNKFLFKQGAGSAIALFITILRIMLVIAIAVPLVNNFKFVALYLAGFISHLIIMSISCILKNK
ncbi:hypothetical protein GND98_010460 [Clostridium butyricum]|uniref:ATP synthase subunit I n=1 Tax=Clostridium butyricum TaxID=1492 RepID=A0A6L9EP63_CLOBU|nr:hypothetical protein [Clostridium butyricum]